MGDDRDTFFADALPAITDDADSWFERAAHDAVDDDPAAGASTAPIGAAGLSLPVELVQRAPRRRIPGSPRHGRTTG